MFSLIAYTNGCCEKIEKTTYDAHVKKVLAFDGLVFITTLVVGILCVMGIIPNVSSAAGFGIIAVPSAIALLYIPILICSIKESCCSKKPFRNWADHSSMQNRNPHYNLNAQS